MQLRHPSGLQNVSQPRFAATFQWDDLPTPPKGYTQPQVIALLEKVAQDAVLNNFVLNQPGTDEIAFTVVKNEGDPGEHDHRYQLKVDYPSGESMKSWLPVRMNIFCLKDVNSLVHSVLDAFYQVVGLDGRQPGLIYSGDVEDDADVDTDDDAPQTKGLAMVAGMDALKQKLMDDVVGPMRDPEKYQKYGLTIPNGILFYGPQGCGKTYVAERLAEELGYTFIPVSMGSAGSQYIHQTAMNLKKIFDDAAKRAPAILFLDEVEALIPDRSGLGGSADHKFEEIGELLTQLAKAAGNNVLVLSATNKPWMLDGAAIRTGRTDKHIYIGPPDAGARREMLAFHLKGRFQDENIPLDQLVEWSDGFAASDLKFWVDEAARHALKHDQPISEAAFWASAEGVTPSISAADLAQFRQFSPRG